MASAASCGGIAGCFGPALARDRLAGVSGGAGGRAVVALVEAFAAGVFADPFVDVVAFEGEPAAVGFGAVAFADAVEAFGAASESLATLAAVLGALAVGLPAVDDVVPALNDVLPALDEVLAVAVAFDAFALALAGFAGALDAGGDSIASDAASAVVDRRLRGRALDVIASQSP
jgi:hypothetical protein